ncbi:probable E3 ubiquitin-protein ligase HERC3 [Diachasma alloeum]|uniref:probable E3 ubiquitin-protein ligase HERC3 n=1 Tax=Diachasma alloeum TaxID=454923 RepID=UPI0007383014|nr:probable E3 ubiquitin-protein ligase HERC3 [Diachasma alloeum]
MLFYSGLNASPLVLGNNKCDVVTDGFSKLSEDFTGVEIEWNYFLVWKGSDLFISGNFGAGDDMRLLVSPEGNESKFIHALADKESVTAVSASQKIWQYKIYEDRWREVDNFLPSNDDNLQEFVRRIDKNSCIVALTNLGRLFNVPNLVDMPKRVKFVDVACGFNHSIILADNGDVYSMGMGTRGQLGHGDLEDCDEPTLIEALAGLNITQIAAGGWHNAALTSDGDLYTWGWNTNGELGITSDQKVIALPTVVDFKTEDGDIVNEHIKKVQCGSNFTICLSVDGMLWGSGSNKYCQLGQRRGDVECAKNFIKLKTDFEIKRILDFSCSEWGTVLNVE